MDIYSSMEFCESDRAKFPLWTMSIYSTFENIRKIAKLSYREFPHLVQNCENICTQNIWRIQYSVDIKVQESQIVFL